MLKGYRTYIMTALGVIDVAAMALGFINEGVGLAALGFLGFGSIATLRAAITNELGLGEASTAPDNQAQQ